MNKRIICLCAMLTLCLSAFSQEGASRLTFKDIFEGRVVPKKEMNQTFVRGDKLKRLNLDSFNCIRFEADEQRLDQVEEIVRRTVDNSPGAETEFDGERLVYAFVILPKSPTGKNRYLGYQIAQDEETYLVTMLYLTGDASLRELKRKLERR